MPAPRFPRVVALALTGFLAVTPTARSAAHPVDPPRSVRFLGEAVVPNGLVFAGTTVGGLSGVDRDPRTGGYVFISDDRSNTGPARFYTAAFTVGVNGVGPVTFTGTKPLLTPSGRTYPPLSADDPSLPMNERTVDPEDLRVDPLTGAYAWSQEGERTATVAIDPSIRVADRAGRHLRDLPIPRNERMAPGTGPRQNLALEGLTFAAAGTLLVSAVEAPLVQDGSESTTEHGSLSRVTVQSRSGRILAQYAYPQEPVFAGPNPPGALATTGVPAVLAVDRLDPTRFLVLERAFVTGVGNKVRIFEFDTRGATNVLTVDSLAGAALRPVRKRLVADLADFPLSRVDNIEGMTWGPPLPTGERTLVLVSDNNFSASQITQVVALAVR